MNKYEFGTDIWYRGIHEGFVLQPLNERGLIEIVFNDGKRGQLKLVEPAELSIRLSEPEKALKELGAAAMGVAKATLAMVPLLEKYVDKYGDEK